VPKTVRVFIEETYGPLRSGEQAIMIRGHVLLAREILQQTGIWFEDITVIDCGTLAPNRYFVRYYDQKDRHIVAMEFDDDLAILTECHSHLAEWIGEDEYFNISWSGHYPAPS